MNTTTTELAMLMGEYLETLGTMERYGFNEPQDYCLKEFLQWLTDNNKLEK